jgi:hypothetical protein
VGSDRKGGGEAAGLRVSGCGDGRVEEEGARHAGRLRLDWAAALRPILSQAVVASWVGLSPKPNAVKIVGKFFEKFGFVFSYFSVIFYYLVNMVHIFRLFFIIR